ncbi:MAG: Membrane protein insertase YidC [Bacteroidia bacterium]|jgi:YidC/Oxa1 family membrane protein insertase|nr:MAG: Membrane protein insertase YidC [Bacteroidia bacterium]
MERSSTIGYILIFFLFLGFWFFNKDNVQQLENQDSTSEITTSNRDSSQFSDNEDIVIKDSFEKLTKIEEKLFTLKNSLLSVDFSNIGGTPKVVNLLDYKNYDSSDLLLIDTNRLQFEYSIPLSNGNVINTSKVEFEQIQSEENSVSYKYSYNGADIIQTYTLKPKSYNLDYSVKFNGFNNTISPNNRYAEITWKSEIQKLEKTAKDERPVTSVYYKYASDDDIDYLSETKDDDETLTSNVQWISFKQKFFNHTLINQNNFKEEGIFLESLEPEDESEAYVKKLSAKLFIPIETNDVVERMAWYFGPNHYPTLKDQNIGLQKIIPLGWGIFGWVNKGLVIPIFNWLNNYFSNYGLIILLLTLIIKLGLFFPMYKVYKSSAKMRILKPELDEIKERTKGDAQKAQQEQMKLYKQAGVSPLGGCLPQLIQMPILFAMFRFFPASIELRQKELWWADDLSSYDSIFDFPNGFEIPFYGDHISLFTLMMTVVTILFTYMNSQNSGQMVGPMKTVMYVMPIMFLGFFNNYAAALSFYYFLSTCITIVQNVVIRKFVIDEDKLHQQIQESKKKKVVMKKSNLQKRLENMAKKRGVDPYTGKAKKKK